MSRRIEVEVKKSDFTPRDVIVPGRFNIILEFKATVPSDSYVFVGGMTRELENWLSPIQRRIDEHVRGLKPVDEETLRRTFSGLLQAPRPSGVTQFLKYDQNYAIPGSSLKGAIRTRVEYKFKLFPIGASYGSYSCYVIQDLFNRPAPHHVKFWGDDVVYSRGSCFPPQVCIVCDLFGSPSLSSRVHFSDALMTSGQVQFIDELRREAALPNSEFRTSVSVLNSDLSDLGLLFLGMELFTTSPILIGAFKYRFNKKFGQEKLRNRYFAGLLKFELQSFKLIFDRLPVEVTSCSDLVNEAREKLQEKYGDYVDIQRGVLS